MLKDYNSMVRKIINDLIEYNVEIFEKDENLTFYEKVDKSLEATISMVKNSFGDLNQNTISEIKSLIKEMINQSTMIVPVFEEPGFKPWLDNVKSEVNWTHRDNYYSYLQTIKGWSVGMVYKSIDKTTDVILDHMANPKANKFFTKKGLVIGDVQSGKTANYTALINKAIDVGYKLIIVLAGQQNDLRTQTQERLDKEVLGYETGFSSNVQNGAKIGVGKLRGHVVDVDSLTNRGNSEDFKKKNETHLLDPSTKPLVAVVKKNTTVLKNLYEYLSKPVNLGINQKLDIPVLIIDDEVDQASVNTKKDPDMDPTRINARIRDLINLCNKVSYVGYTATPYANVLIDANANNDLYGEDLFPKDFIVVLPTPKNYCGVDAFFGDGVDTDNDLIEYIDDVEMLVNQEIEDNILKLSSQDEIECLSPSLCRAIDDFIVASAVRRSRGEKTHNGMMIHLAAYKKPATSLTELLEDYINDLKNEFYFDNEKSLEKYENVWKQRFNRVSIKRNKNDNWDSIKNELKSVFELIKVKLLNGDSKDVIDYTETTQSQIIAVGGNKLSRGITIEGLMISYYLRDPRAYDTAMQMGRWFGYKESYIDLCRIYSQPDLIANFVHILDATKMLREDIEIMNSKKLSPSNFGLKVLTHPTMLPTAKNKMRAGTNMAVSFSEQRQETIRFNLNKKSENQLIIRSFIDKLKEDSLNDDLPVTLYDEFKAPIFKKVNSNYILNLLEQYHDYKEGVSSNVERWKKYIKALNEDDELTDWTVVLSNPDEERLTFPIGGGFDIKKRNRKSFGVDQHDYIRAISAPSDFKYFFVDEDMQNKYRKGYDKKDDNLKLYFNKHKALLVIYVIDITNRDNKNEILEDNVIGLAIWFPETNNRKGKLNYIVNSVYANQDEVEAVYGDE